MNADANMQFSDFMGKEIKLQPKGEQYRIPVTEYPIYLEIK